MHPSWSLIELISLQEGTQRTEFFLAAFHSWRTWQSWVGVLPLSLSFRSQRLPGFLVMILFIDRKTKTKQTTKKQTTTTKTEARTHLMHYRFSKDDSIVSFLKTKPVCSLLHMGWDLCSPEDWLVHLFIYFLAMVLWTTQTLSSGAF